MMTVTYVSFVPCPTFSKSLRWVNKVHFAVPSHGECQSLWMPWQILNSDFRNAVAYFWKVKLFITETFYFLIICKLLYHISPGLDIKRNLQRSSGFVFSLTNEETQRSWETGRVTESLILCFVVSSSSCHFLKYLKTWYVLSV